MRIKTFQGRTLEELLPEIRAELGAGAVVIGQRTKVQGGIGGFFGTKVIEVTAADRMPDDDQLVALEDQLAGGSGGTAGGDGGAGADDETALAARFREAMATAGSPGAAARVADGMRMGRQGGVDAVDSWDPSQDAELAQEYGRVLEHAAAAAAGNGFADLDVPTADPRNVVNRDGTHGGGAQASHTMPGRAAGAAPAAHGSLGSAAMVDADLLAQARALAGQTHRNVQAAADRVDATYRGVEPPHAGTVQPSGTYTAPRPLPRTGPATPPRTFAASVVDAPEAFGYGGPTAGHMPTLDGSGSANPSSSVVEDALREDLGFGPSGADAIAQAMDLIDVRAVAALRSAVDASKRIDAGHRAEQVTAELADVLDTLERVGVDADVIATVADTVLRHRRPFAPAGTPLTELVRDVLEELVDVRSGFTSAGRAHAMALVGPSSSGKSTVVAKLAQTYHAAGMRVAVAVVMPDDPTAPIIQDPRFMALGADVRYVTSREQAALAAEAFASHELVLVDTPGSTYLDDSTFDHVRSCLSALGVEDVHVVVPLATSSREAASIVEAFRPLGANRLVVSRLDESRYVGQLLNFGFRLGVPMTFLSDGPRVPDDLRAASQRAIVERILPADTRPASDLASSTSAVS